MKPPIAFAVLAATLCGCAGNMYPQNPTEFKAAMQRTVLGMTGKTQKTVVAQSLDSYLKKIQGPVERCLNRRCVVCGPYVTEPGKGTVNMCHSFDVTTLVQPLGSGSYQLTMQEKASGDLARVFATLPKNGEYSFVMDIQALSKTQVQLTEYYGDENRRNFVVKNINVGQAACVTPFS